MWHDKNTYNLMYVSCSSTLLKYILNCLIIRRVDPIPLFNFFFILQPPFLGMFNFRFFFHIYISVLNPPFLGAFKFSFFFNIHMSVLKPQFLGVFKFRFFFNNNIFVLNLLFLGVFQALLWYLHFCLFALTYNFVSFC